MQDGPLRSVIRHLRRVIVAQEGVRSLPDAQLLEAFLHHRDESAVEMLIWRYGAMVLNLCHRILNDEHLAEDAFQATFLVFVRKAGSISKRQSVGGWLCKVAYRVAQQLRVSSGKQAQQSLEVDVEDLRGRQPAQEVMWRDLRTVLDEEIDRLPEKYRLPIILCYLQGHTNEDAAEVLGCPKGTVLSRLAQGRELLRARLTRRGLALPAGWLATHLSVNASSAAVPAALAHSTVKAVVEFAAGKAAMGLASSSIAALTQGVLQAMFVTKMKIVVAVVLVFAVLGMGAGFVAQWALANSPPGQEVTVVPASLPPVQQKDAAKPDAGGDKDAKLQEKGRVDPPDAPLEARLVAKEKTYILDRGGKTAEEYANMINKETLKAHLLPPPPKVELILELYNTSDKEITILIGGHAGILNLDLKGPGVLSRPAAIATAGFRKKAPGVQTAIAPGKKSEIPIVHLSTIAQFNPKGTGFFYHFSYWIQPGDYTLTANYKTKVSGFGDVSVTSPPIKLKVVDKK